MDVSCGSRSLPDAKYKVGCMLDETYGMVDPI